MNGKRSTRNVRYARGSLMGVSLSYRLLRSKRWRNADGNVIKKVIEVSAAIIKDIPKKDRSLFFDGYISHIVFCVLYNNDSCCRHFQAQIAEELYCSVRSVQRIQRKAEKLEIIRTDYNRKKNISKPS